MILVWEVALKVSLSNHRRSSEGIPSLLGVGIYSAQEASQLIKVPASSIRRWLWGYRFRSRDGSLSHSDPLWRSQVPTVEDSKALGFRDLIELQFVAHFKHHGLSLQSIRKTIDVATELLTSSYPLSSIKFKTDGKRVLADVLDEHERRLVFDLYTGQYLLSFIWDKLYDALEYSDYDELLRWWPTGKIRRVLVDPKRNFGQPISPEGVPTRVLANSFGAEKSYESVAHWYNVELDSVRHAVDFERDLRAA